MKPLTIVLIVIALLLVAAVIALYFFGKKAQKKQADQQVQLEANKQYVSMLIIDKARLRMKDSGLPQMVIDQTPKYLRRSKVPVVKVKVGPQIATLMCNEQIFNTLPIKKEVKAALSGIYIMEVKALHGHLPKVEAAKKSWYKRTLEKLQEKAGAKPL